MDLLDKILNNSSDGYIEINREGQIIEYNRRAKEIFGIVNKTSNGHDQGRIESGDFIIIADNHLGYDDGNLSLEDLKVFNINHSLKYGEGFILAGTYGNQKQAQVISGKGPLSFETEFKGKKIKVSIQPVTREISIQVGKQEFSTRYIYSFGHMVILNSSGKIKFYQEQGYTARGESIQEIVSGKDFISKYPNQSLDVEGKLISEIHTGDIVEEFYKVALGKSKDILKKSITINGTPVVCDIYHTQKGACMRIEDISQYESLILSKEKILRHMEMMQPSFDDAITHETIDFLGNNQGIENVRKLAYKAAQSLSTVVLLGESGTGKSLLARQIHENSTFYKGAFIEVNCSAIPESLFESEFFGYDKGAFTGASEQGKKGFFELANHGTLFLDEIAELPLNMQSKLLHSLQNRRFYRLGGSHEVSVDFRVIVATNKNLIEEVKKERFREDLFYRLNVFPIDIPNLRSRKEDIPLLVGKVLPEVRKKTLKSELRISPEAMIYLSGYSWPGNVRELENVLERVANIIDHDTIIPIYLDMLKTSNINTLDLKIWVKNLEKNLIRQAIEMSEGDYKRAMDLLHIKKSSFYDKLKKYHLE